MNRTELALQTLAAGGVFRFSQGRFRNAPNVRLIDAAGKRVRGVGMATLWEVVTERGLYVADGPARSLDYRSPRNDAEAAQLVRKIY